MGSGRSWGAIAASAPEVWVSAVQLKRHRDNGYSLFGLRQSLLAQGREEEAAAVAERLLAAWSAADVELTSSRF